MSRSSRCRPTARTFRRQLRTQLDELHNGQQTQAGRSYRLTRAADITPEAVVWAWRDNGAGRIPAGTLTLFAGREGTGKSSAAIWLAAEDSWSHTLVPRLLAAGADLDLIYRLNIIERYDDAESESTLSRPTDFDLLERSSTKSTRPAPSSPSPSAKTTTAKKSAS